MKRPLPSALLRALLARLLGPSDDDALGDLEEEHARRLRRRGRVAAELRYAVEAVSLLRAVLPARARALADAGWSPVRDLALAARSLGREPGAAAAIVLTLAVAVGGTTAVFAVAEAAFLRPLPWPDADRLARVYSGSRQDPGAMLALSPLDLRDIENFDAVVEDVGVWTLGESVHVTVDGEPRRLEAPRASAALFRVLGLEPEAGRFFTPEEEEPGGDDAVVLSHALWTEAFGADPEAVGRTVELDGRSHRVIGVAPPLGTLPAGADAWRALALGPEWYDAGRWGWQFLAAVARLQPGVEPAAASRALTERLARAVPERVERGQTRVVRTLHEERVGGSGPALVLLLVAGGLLLALACANVTSVVLARSERRVPELALRRALGSGASPLVRLVAAETGVLAAAGGLGGLSLALVGLGLLRRADPGGLAYVQSVRLDAGVGAFALGLTVLTAAVIGLAPARRALRSEPRAALGESGARAGASRAARRARNALVVLQVAIASVLLAAVGVSGTAFLRLVERDPGFRPEGVLTASIELPAGQEEEGALVYRSLVERLASLPGVTAAGAVGAPPLTGRGWSASIELVDPDPGVTDPDPGGNMRPVAPGYFATVGIPVVAGRTFTDADVAGAPPVVIVDEVLARRYWPGGSPVGRRVVVGALSREPATIVGVVGAVPDESLARPGGGHVYFPVFQRAVRGMTLVVRTDGDAGALAAAVRGVVRDVAPRVPVTEISTLEARVADSLAARRAALILLATFGATAVLLAAVGIYGVLSYAVARRTHEIGTRMALGADPRAVLRSVVAEAMRLWLAGALLGGAAALGAATVLARSVAAVGSVGPLPWVSAFLGLGVVALAAALVPAARATAVDPAEALRAR